MRLHRPNIAGWSLQARLMAGLVALLAAVCLVVGVVTEIALHRFLLGQLDTRLLAASGRAASHGPPPPGGLGQSNGFPLGQSAGTLAARISSGQVTDFGVLDGSSTLPSKVASLLLKVPADNHTRTLHLASLGDYRVIADRLGNGDILITGLPEHDVAATLMRLGIVVACVAGAALILAAVVGAIIVRRTMRPLSRVGATAVRVSELPLDRGEVALSVRVPDEDADPRTEVGQVGAAINRMLGHVADALRARHASETRVRQFVADASHELRTPLAAIRGYAELTRRSRDAVPPDIAHAMRRVESESIRMTALVEDLLLLARLDSGRPLEREPVDLSRLVVDVVSDAHVAGPGHTWKLDIPQRSFITVGDSARLHQAVANLLANARTHTPAGSIVSTSLSLDAAGNAALSVVDNGPGIPADLLPEIFERFARGDTSRSRAAGSTGLGLAIVAAVVEAHLGTVTVTSGPGRTEFTLSLPLTTVDGESQALHSGLTAAGKLGP
jgi:two-component system OmpR family sensor kinase